MPPKRTPIARDLTSVLVAEVSAPAPGLLPRMMRWIAADDEWVGQGGKTSGKMPCAIRSIEQGWERSRAKSAPAA